MRDPERIDRMIELLRAKWKASPEQRLGQLICNIAERGEGLSAFYIEDASMEQRLALASAPKPAPTTEGK